MISTFGIQMVALAASCLACQARGNGGRWDSGRFSPRGSKAYRRP